MYKLKNRLWLGKKNINTFQIHIKMGVVSFCKFYGENKYQNCSLSRKQHPLENGKQAKKFVATIQLFP